MLDCTEFCVSSVNAWFVYSTEETSSVSASLLSHFMLHFLEKDLVKLLRTKIQQWIINTILLKIFFVFLFFLCLLLEKHWYSMQVPFVYIILVDGFMCFFSLVFSLFVGST